MTIEAQINEVEVSIEDAKKAIALRDELMELRKNPSFDKIIEKGYFSDESRRVVLLKEDMNCQSDEQQKDLAHTIIGIGQLFQYFRTIIQLGNQAEHMVSQYEETLDELQEEQRTGTDA